MDRILIHGSSWTVGAYQKSKTPNSDELVSGGLAELLSQTHIINNISVQDNMNLGIWIGLCEHLKKDLNYDRILICQNDPSLDFGIWKNSDTEWLKQFPYTRQEIIENNVNTITKLIEFLLERFYMKLGEISEFIPIHIFGGPSKVNQDLAKKHGLTVITPDWISGLLPSFESTYLESTVGLDYMTQWLIETFPTEKHAIKQEFLEYVEQLNLKLETYRNNSELFAYHHPTALGNNLYYEKIKDLI